MATTIKEIVDQVRLILQDVDVVRWQDQELFMWVGSAYREIVSVKPTIGSKRTDFTLVSGTAQQLPMDGLSLIDIIRNTTGAMMPVHQIERTVLDNTYPTWHTDVSTGQIKCCVYDPTAPTQFWVWPQATAGMRVEMIYSAVPARPTSLSDSLAINDGYSGLVIDYLLYRAYSKDAGAGDMNLANNYRQAFYDSLNGGSTHRGEAQFRRQGQNGVN